MKKILLVIFLLGGVFLINNCSNDQPLAPSENGNDFNSLAKVNYPEAGYYVVEYKNSETDFTEAVNALDGTVDAIHPEIKVAKVSNLTASNAIKLSKSKNVKDVTMDLLVQWVKPENGLNDESIGNDETFWAYQWAPRSIQAPEAWDLGARGNGVRVAVIDGGISSNHIDLDDNIDIAASASFVSGYNFDEDVPGFRHASHVAGIIAAEDNEIGTIGIAPNATIIGLKALHDGSGSFSAIISAILYAANEADADVINMSLGAFFPRNSNEAAKLINSLGHAVNYAYQNGVTVIVSAGNDGIDFDHAAMYVHMPSEVQHVINVSATGPVDFAYGGTNFDRPASYTNYGQSFVDFAAPGGDFVSQNPLWYFDMVISPSYVVGSTNYYSFAAGTSMAAPHVAGVAALIIEAAGGTLSPAQVEAKIRASADDLGKPGNDDYYGLGRINALRAVQ